MIQRLRLKFVAVCMALVTAVLAVMLLAVSGAMRYNISDLSSQVLYRVLREDVPGQGGRLDAGIRIGGDRVQLPYFTVNVWPEREGYTAVVTGGTYADLENTEELSAILRDCLSQNSLEGTVEAYHLRFLAEHNGLYLKLAFVDTSMEQRILQEMMGSYLQIASAGFLLLLAVSILLAWWTTRPVERAWRQQRQFLSDASHELKTPLTVILSNAALLEDAALEERPARWADNIHSEARQMKTLVEEMLTLARADNLPRPSLLTEASLSDAAADAALAFEPVAFEAGKPLCYDIARGVTVLGDGDKLKRLASLLLDNAIKYGAADRPITMTLSKTERQARLTVSNAGEPIPPEQLRRLFQRFYRADASRGERSGFGLGLSIGAAIAKEHRGTLRAESDETSTRFIFTMPLKR